MYFLSSTTVLIVIVAIISGYNCISVGTDAPDQTRGQNTSIKEWPWYVSLTDPDDNTHYCGGALIANEWVLTAALCVNESFGMPMWPQSVTLGSASANVTRLDNGEYQSRMIGGQQCRVKRAYNHPQFDEESDDFNVALLHIDCQLPFTIADIKPIALPVNENNFLQQESGKLVFMIGMGEANRKKYLKAHTLHQAKLRTVHLNQCAEQVGDVPISEMCTRGKTISKEFGSPLVRHLKGGTAILYGLYSGTYKDTIISGFHYVPTSLEWIHKVTNMKNIQIIRMEQEVKKLKDATNEANNASMSVKEDVEHLAHAMEEAYNVSTIAVLFGCVNTIIIIIVMICVLVRCCHARCRHKQLTNTSQYNKIVHPVLGERNVADACGI